MLKVMEDIVPAGKKPDFNESDWAPYAAFVDTKVFRRVDIFGSAVNWQQYEQSITHWARNYWCTGYVRRISQVGNLVYVENSERSTATPTTQDGTFNSIGVYKFNQEGKVVDIEIYAQRPQAE